MEFLIGVTIIGFIATFWVLLVLAASNRRGCETLSSIEDLLRQEFKNSRIEDLLREEFAAPKLFKSFREEILEEFGKMLEATGKILERTDKIEEMLDEMTEALGKIAANKTQMESLYEIKTY